MLRPYLFFFCSGLLVILSHGEYLNGKAVSLIHLNVTIMNVIHVVDAITSMPPGSCNGYTNLTDPWRNYAFTRTDWLGWPNNDILLHNKWWRFTGIGGDTAISQCASNTGGFHHPWQVVVTYPDIESLTPTRGTTRTWSTGCNTHGIPVEFVFCPGGFHVFRPLNAGPSNSGFATCENILLFCISPLYNTRIGPN